MANVQKLEVYLRNRYMRTANILEAVCLSISSPHCKGEWTRLHSRVGNTPRAELIGLRNTTQKNISRLLHQRSPETTKAGFIGVLLAGLSVSTVTFTMMSGGDRASGSQQAPLQGQHGVGRWPVLGLGEAVLLPAQHPQHLHRVRLTCELLHALL